MLNIKENTLKNTWPIAGRLKRYYVFSVSSESLYIINVIDVTLSENITSFVVKLLECNVYFFYSPTKKEVIFGYIYIFNCCISLKGPKQKL